MRRRLPSVNAYRLSKAKPVCDIDPSATGSTLGGRLPGWFQTYFEHVLSGRGYQFWSGIGSDIGELTLLTAFAIWIRQRNCHVYRCWRLAWHPHPEHGHPVCRHHHPDHRRISASSSTG
jgi:hypothetical protein